MFRKIKEWISIQLVKNPGRMVLVSILLFNVLFFLISAGVISALSLQGTEHMGFIEAAICTITMILDAGCIQFVIEDIGNAGVVISLTCLTIIIVGMISFTGAVIGYITNYISHFIEAANSGKRALHLSGHTVILNWNTRASEIINDLLYSGKKERVVVLVGDRREEIVKEIEERISDTVRKERANDKSFKKNLVIIVREGDVFSSSQLHDISLEYARSVIILGNDINNTVCKFEHRELVEELGKGNSLTVKTLMQVSDITAAEYSRDDQKIIVEITDPWTAQLVDRIIAYKQREGKCNIVPVRINSVLGQLLSQFSLMPELNSVYRELFSNKGATFYSVRQDRSDEVEYSKKYMETHRHSLPLTFMDKGDKSYCYYISGSESDITKTSSSIDTRYSVKLDPNYWMERKNVIILGHNSKMADIMMGFVALEREWNIGDTDIANVVVIDDKKSLEKHGYYSQYSFVNETVAADIYERELICSTIKRCVDANNGDTSILILSDDDALNENIDAGALTNLVYVQDIINEKVAANPDFDVESIDLIVEIIDPKHHDIVSSYSVNNVVISNRYISKMITQISEKEALFQFYTDIITYDEEGGEYESKEIYIRKVSRLFTELPGPCTAYELIRAVYEASTSEELPPEKRNPAIVLGYVKPGGRTVLFSGDQKDVMIELEEKDKLIVFTNH